LDELLIRHIDLAKQDISSLQKTASEEGFCFVDRLVSEWRDGTNRFTATGELFLGAFNGEKLIGFGGINIDHYAVRPNIGRIRHLYVAPEYRRLGVGEAILGQLMALTCGLFDRIRLRTDTTEAARFYERQGFQSVNSTEASHTIVNPFFSG
jgi:GNAT superfamily N-acetyltransferase